MNRIRAILRDTYTSSQLAIVALGVAGLVGIALGAAGAADAQTLDAQLPFVVSGGLGGFALVIVAVGLFGIQRQRLAATNRRAQLDSLIRAVAALATEDDR